MRLADAPVVKEQECLTAGEVADRAISCLELGVGFSLVRLGDGEGRLLAWPGGIHRAILNRHLRFWFGRADFSDLAIMAMQAVLVTAIDMADILGVYQGRIRNQWWQVPWMYVRRTGRDEESVCSVDVHQALWMAGHLHRVADACDSIVLVTCRDVGEALSSKFDRDVQWIEVPEEGHTAGQAMDHWRQFNSIEAEVREAAGRGSLVLVGAGVLGKAYTCAAASAGSVALDIGSVFDGWAGVPSRTYLARSNGRFDLGKQVERPAVI